MFSPWEYFSLKELSCPCCGKMEMNPEFMEKLVLLRKECNFPFKITSAYRCEAHNRAIHGKSGSSHLTGNAVDIQVYGNRAYDIITKAGSYGMAGIGVSQNGEHQKRFIHLDDAEGDTRPWLWSY